MSRSLKGAVFMWALLFSLAIGFVMLILLLVTVFRDGLPYLDMTLLTNPPSSDPEIAGARPAILATLYIGVLLLLFVVPLGVGTAVYLEEYANKTRWPPCRRSSTASSGSPSSFAASGSVGYCWRAR